MLPKIATRRVGGASAAIRFKAATQITQLAEMRHGIPCHNKEKLKT
jgi:hypothetical protein